MNRARATALSLVLLVPADVCEVAGEDLQIGIVDFYGLGRVSEGAARAALTVKEGDTVSQVGDDPPTFMAESERRLSALPGVARAHVGFVCCDAGRWIVYVGLEERGSVAPQFRVAPTGNVRLAVDVVQAGEDYSKAFWNAVQRGDVGEDDSQGHALLHDQPTRAVQERLVRYAARDLKELRQVLRDASDPEQRALAAEVLGYVAHKQDVVDDLVYGMGDPYAGVRNNAMRAMALFAGMAPGSGRSSVRIPPEPFVAALKSLIWTDRNKASLALLGLTARRDPDLLEKLRRDALTPLIEMARWKNAGHAYAALMILGRIGGQSDEAIAAAVERGDREGIIGAALARH
jgi:hypothetical protein